MIDVFFRGYGAWYETIYHRHYDEYGNEDDAPDVDAEQLTTNQQVSGVFSLCPDDEVAYKHTKNFDGVKVLMESTHQDRPLWSLGCLINDRENCYFLIDTSIIKPVLVIAQPDKPPQAKTAASRYF